MSFFLMRARAVRVTTEPTRSLTALPELILSSKSAIYGTNPGCGTDSAAKITGEKDAPKSQSLQITVSGEPSHDLAITTEDRTVFL